MSQLTMITIYELVDDVCCRDFNTIIGKLTPENKNKFVEASIDNYIDDLLKQKIINSLN